MRRIFALTSVFIFVLSLTTLSLPDKSLALGSSTVVINEIQTGGLSASGAELTGNEFIELFNIAALEVDVNNWKVEYISASGITITPLATLSGKIQPQSMMLLTTGGYLTEISNILFQSSLAKTAGHIRIVDDNGLTIDKIGWGSAAINPETKATAAIPAGSSMQRYLDCATELSIDTDDNSLDFVINNVPSPGILDGPLKNCPESEPEPDPTGGLGGGSSCEGLIISELLPNPAGSDTDKEFVELFNPTQETIPLLGCKLQTSANSKIFELADGQIEPGQYLALYNNETRLTLANSSGGTVFLIDSDNTEIYQVDYEEDLADDVSWSLINDNWFKTFSITPNAPNQLLESKPCPAGQTRNTETDRCINIVEATGLAACKVGQERNPETNRCRNIASLASTLKACAPDQERNPDTSRCRKIANASSLTPCKPGQERNPETNRCRNVSGSSSGEITDVKDVLSATSTNKTSWLVAIGAVLAALFYAIWEWRNELLQLVSRFRNKFSFKQ